MTMLGRWIRNLIERIIHTFYEGPHIPKRLLVTPLEWAIAHPRATREQWLEFCQLYGTTVYTAAYTRGLEFAERDLDRMPRKAPELMEEAIKYEWSLDIPLDKVGSLNGDEVVTSGNPPDAITPEFHKLENAYRDQYLKGRAGLK